MRGNATNESEYTLIVEVREGNAVLCANRLANDDLVDVVELVPVLVANATNHI
jgi:hypothetical protein